MDTEVCLWEMVRSDTQWNRLLVLGVDGEFVTVELQVQKPDTPLCTMQADVPGTVEALQRAFAHVGNTWSQLSKEEVGRVFKATRVVAVPTAERVILLIWHVHHVEGIPYQIEDDLEVACIAYSGPDTQLIIEHPYT